MCNSLQVIRKLSTNVSKWTKNGLNFQKRFGTSGGKSGWRWENDGAGMGGKEFDVATEVKEGVGSIYKVPEYFNYHTDGNYFFYDMEKELVDSGLRLKQPKSGLTDGWPRGAA